MYTYCRKLMDHSNKDTSMPAMCNSSGFRILRMLCPTSLFYSLVCVYVQFSSSEFEKGSSACAVRHYLVYIALYLSGLWQLLLEVHTTTGHQQGKRFCGIDCQLHFVRIDGVLAHSF